MIPKNFPIVFFGFFFHLLRPRVLPKKIFLLLGIYTRGIFYTFDLDTFQSPSTFKSFSSSVQVNSVMISLNLIEVEKCNCQPASVCYSVQCKWKQLPSTQPNAVFYDQLFLSVFITY